MIQYAISQQCMQESFMSLIEDASTTTKSVIQSIMKSEMCQMSSRIDALQVRTTHLKEQIVLQSKDIQSLKSERLTKRNRLCCSPRTFNPSSQNDSLQGTDCAAVQGHSIPQVRTTHFKEQIVLQSKDIQSTKSERLT
eukprot:TRINITY_DN58571_c0_g2_i1.p1 TRINITY_DN58571_c0_g2~~TRINITY_DN58571_c0_g2_i1.p1  ORF type:complete len:138 (-),score=19.95 TRINITY_DN58571_c0_g2_i1:22-435(-)